MEIVSGKRQSRSMPDAPSADAIADDMAIRNLRKDLWSNMSTGRPQSAFIPRSDSFGEMMPTGTKTDDDIPVRKPRKYQQVRRSMSGNIAELVKQFSKSDSELKDESDSSQRLTVQHSESLQVSPMLGRTRTPRSVKQRSELKRHGKFDWEYDPRYPDSEPSYYEYENPPVTRHEVPYIEPVAVKEHGPVFGKFKASDVRQRPVLVGEPHVEQQEHAPVFGKVQGRESRQHVVVSDTPVNRTYGEGFRPKSLDVEDSPAPPPRLNLDMRRAALLHEPPALTSPRGSPMSDKELDDLLSSLSVQTAELESAARRHDIMVRDARPNQPSLIVLPVDDREGKGRSSHTSMPWLSLTNSSVLLGIK